MTNAQRDQLLLDLALGQIAILKAVAHSLPSKEHLAKFQAVYERLEKTVEEVINEEG